MESITIRNILKMQMDLLIKTSDKKFKILKNLNEKEYDEYCKGELPIVEDTWSCPEEILKEANDYMNNLWSKMFLKDSLKTYKLLQEKEFDWDREELERSGKLLNDWFFYLPFKIKRWICHLH